ncbi:MAG: DsbA family oxidoreductase, partial [Hylemonella sp.]|nr:DsbA family oxidoreductase [Hylemonella sp.]
VSDVACPWCAVGLAALEQALARVDGEIDAELRFHPFELNPAMGPEGQDVVAYLSEKYGTTAEQQAQTRETIRQRGAEVGFSFRPEGRGRIWNTFDAHRLLHWAGQEDAAKQHRLKKALLEAYHGRAESPADAQVLLGAVAQAGLDAERARAILAGDEFALEVRAQEQHFQRAGIHSVPAVILNNRYLISGGQPVAVFEDALRRIAAEAPQD